MAEPTVHGIFDDGDIAVRIVQALADKKRVSWKPEAGGDYHAFKEQQYDKLAQGLREHLDMEYVYSILQESRISSGFLQCYRSRHKSGQWIIPEEWTVGIRKYSDRNRYMHNHRDPYI